MIDLAEMLPPRPSRVWALVKQAGVDSIVATLNGGEQDQRMFASVGARSHGASRHDDSPWSLAALERDAELFAEHGFRVSALEDTAPLDAARLGAPGRDEQIEHVIEQVHAMGALGIPVLCYNWMASGSWSRTTLTRETRGGALVTAFDADIAETLPPLADEGAITEQQLWDSLDYFLDAVLPAAEQHGILLALHPDDPPRAVVRNVPRIIRSADAYRRLIERHPSPSNAITFCQGNFALMGDDMPALIREFGTAGRIGMSHFRDVKGDVDRFEETFHDAGPTNMASCMSAYDDAGFSGPMRPDHVPTMAGETNQHPGYETLGRLFALGYIRGLTHGIERKPTR